MKIGYFRNLNLNPFNQEDIEVILKRTNGFEFSDDAINYLATRTNQFRQLVKLINNKIEKLSQTNQFKKK